MSRQIDALVRNIPAKGLFSLKTSLSIISSIMLFGVSSLVADVAADTLQPPSMQTNHSVKTSENKTVKEFIAMMNKPTNPVELLKNIKFVIENNLLLRDDFFIDEYLNKAFGGTEISWHKNEPNNKEFMVFNLKDVFQTSYSSDGIGCNRRRLDETGILNERGKITARLGFYGFGDTRFTVESIENVFGSDMQVINPYKRLNRSIALLPKTHKLGNQKLIYRIDSPTATTVISFLIKGNGIVKKADFEQEEK